MIGIQAACFWVIFSVGYLLSSIENGSIRFD